MQSAVDMTATVHYDDTLLDDEAWSDDEDRPTPLIAMDIARLQRMRDQPLPRPEETTRTCAQVELGALLDRTRPGDRASQSPFTARTRGAAPEEILLDEADLEPLEEHVGTAPPPLPARSRQGSKQPWIVTGVLSTAWVYVVAFAAEAGRILAYRSESSHDLRST